MSRFNERLALMADAARALDSGDELARGLLRLAADVDDYLAERLSDRSKKLNAAFSAWNEFLNSSLASAFDETDRKIAIERRKLARAVAADPRWQGGYADALKLLASGETD